MKKNCIAFLVIVALMVSACGFAMAEQAKGDDMKWFELGSDKRTVTIRVPSERDDGCEWNYVISNEKALELLTSEDTSDESADGTGVFAASFLSTLEEFGDVEVIMNCERETEIVKSCTLSLSIRENGDIEVVGYSVAGEWNDWLTLTQDNFVINVSLPANATTGYAWSYDISNPDLVANVSEEYIPNGADADALGAGGVWQATFEGTQKEEGDGGDVTLTFRYQRGDEQPVITCEAEMWLVENGEFEIVSAMAAATSFVNEE